MKRVILFALALCFSGILTAQVVPNIGQFKYAQLYYNPAYAGSSNSVQSNFIFRKQWSGVTGAPNTQLFTLESPVSNHIGAGMTVFRHEVGLQTQIGGDLNGSYKLKLSKEMFFNFGLKAGLLQVQNNYDDAFRWDDNDALIEGAATSGMLFKIGAGAYFQYKKHYVGMGIPDLTVTDSDKMFYDHTKEESTIGRNVIISAGSQIELNEYMTLIPDVMARFVSNGETMMHANVGVEFNQTFTAGAAWSTNKIFGVYTRVAISPRIKLGYHFELENKNHAIANGAGTHEVMISYGYR